MKKFYSALVALLVAVTANAGLYMSGQFNGWSHCNAAQEFKETSTAGVYTLTVDKLYGEFLICSGTEGKPNWNALRYGSNGSKVQEGKEYSVTKNGTANFTMDGTVNNATVTLNTNANTLLVKGAAQANSFTVVYLIGDIDGAGWNEDLTTYPLTAKGNDTYEGDITVTATSYVKPRCGNNILSASGEDIVPVMGTTYDLGAGDKAIMLSAGTYTVTVVADQKAETGKITFTSGDQPGPDPQPSTVKFYADLNGAGFWTAYDLTDGKYTFEVTSTSFFSFSDGEPKSDWSNVWRPDNGETEVTENGTYSAKGSNDKVFFITTPGTYTVTPDATAKTFSITGFSGTVTYPETLYIIGYVNGLDFQANTTGMASTKAENGVYTWVGALIGDATAGTGTEAVGYINIATMVSAEATDWDSVINSADRYGAPAADTPLVVGTPADVEVYKAGVNASGCQSWKVKEGKYDVTLDIPSLKISIVTITSGIESVEVENAAPVYYNLQGVRVMNPENGMFIEVRGNKAVKVMK